MKYPTSKTNCILAVAIAGLFLSFPVSADKPTWAGSGKDEEKHEEKEGKQRHDDRDRERYEERRIRHEGESRQRGSVEVNIKIGSYFDDRRRDAVHDYYHEQFRSGNCPPPA